MNGRVTDQRNQYDSRILTKEEPTRILVEDAYLENALEITAIVESLTENRSQLAVEIDDGFRESGAVGDEGLVIRLEDIASTCGEGDEELLEFLEHAYDPRTQRSPKDAAYLNLLQLRELEDSVEEPLDVRQSFQESVQTSEDGDRVERPWRSFRFQAGRVPSQFELFFEFFQDS